MPLLFPLKLDPINLSQKSAGFCGLCFAKEHQGGEFLAVPLQVRLTSLQRRENNKRILSKKGIGHHCGDDLNTIGTHSTLPNVPQQRQGSLKASVVLVQYTTHDRHQANRPRRAKARGTVDDRMRRKSEPNGDP